MLVYIMLIMVLLLIPVPAYTFIRMVLSFAGRRSQRAKEGGVGPKTIDSYSSIVIYVFLLLCFFLNDIAVDAGEQLRVFELTGAMVGGGYASLAKEYILTVVVILTLGVISFWVITFYEASLSPVVYVVCSTLIILNILFIVAYLTHTGFSHDGEKVSVILMQISFLSLLFLFIARLKDSLDQFIDSHHNKEMEYNNKLLLLLYRLSNNYKNMPKLWMISLFPVLIIIQLLLVLFGQRPDSFVRVFLETSSFNYSNIPAPKPEIVEGDGHYLCTVTARGHQRLVKPFRAGIRRGVRIPVNRQLLIANAFENILEQHMPNLHKKIRDFYDTYGYPISRHINSKWSANMIYLLMKPLEWFFLLVLYTVDKNPENRIHMQYSELRK